MRKANKQAILETLRNDLISATLCAEHIVRKINITYFSANETGYNVVLDYINDHLGQTVSEENYEEENKLKIALLFGQSYAESILPELAFCDLIIFADIDEYSLKVYKKELNIFLNSNSPEDYIRQVKMAFSGKSKQQNVWLETWSEQFHSQYGGLQSLENYFCFSNREKLTHCRQTTKTLLENKKILYKKIDLLDVEAITLFANILRKNRAEITILNVTNISNEVWDPTGKAIKTMPLLPFSKQCVVFGVPGHHRGVLNSRPFPGYQEYLYDTIIGRVWFELETSSCLRELVQIRQGFPATLSVVDHENNTIFHHLASGKYCPYHPREILGVMLRFLEFDNEYGLPQNSNPKGFNESMSTLRSMSIFRPAAQDLTLDFGIPISLKTIKNIHGLSLFEVVRENVDMLTLLNQYEQKIGTKILDDSQHDCT